MRQPSHTELLLERLQAIRAEKDALMKKVEALNAEEQRINYAVDVIVAVVGENAIAPESMPIPAVVASASVGAAEERDTALALGKSDPAPVEVTSEKANRPRQSLEEAILEIFSEKTGMTSTEVVDMVQIFTTVTAKRESILSTLSRMSSKGLLRREGKLYFLVKKGESPEVGTSGLSVATESVAGQHTSSAPIGEEGEDEL